MSSFRRVLVLGGARSGKSRFAERIAAERGGPVLYVATATATDEEMAERIRRHQADRPSHWHTVEAQTNVAQAAGRALGGSAAVLVEDLGFLLTNLLLGTQQDATPTGDVEQAAEREIEALFALPVNVVVVSNEVGMGLVPPYPLGRAFRDALGRLNQYAAARADEVFVLIAGLPLRLKPPAPAEHALSTPATP